MEIFKAYDIRGKYAPGEIDTTLAFRVGKAFVRFLNATSYIVGHDARSHSRDLYEAAIRGLVSEGKKVTGIGLVSTPCLHFLQVREGFGGGLMITASHNPAEYHGFKLFDASGGSISYEKGLDKIKGMVLAMNDRDGSSPIQPDKPELIDEYIGFLARLADNETYKLHIAIDVSNGSAGKEEELVFSRLGIDATILNKEPDGTFPIHSPNPLEEKSRQFISKKVRELNCDFGVILDGDGDRVLFSDEKGNVIENYFVSALFSDELLAHEPGQAIVYDLISSRVLPERVRELGGKPVVSRVGYTYLYDKMVSERALFGAEASGHVYFRVTDSFYTESATYAIILLLKVLARTKKKLSELIAPLAARYYQAPEINREIEDKEASMKRIEQAFGGSTIERLDGISIDRGDYWFNVRPSNTEPFLRIRLEAKSKAIADEAIAKIMGLLG